MITHVIHPGHSEHVWLIWLYHMPAQVIPALVEGPEMAMQAKRNSHHVLRLIS
jgi:hypothetical protein